MLTYNDSLKKQMERERSFQEEIEVAHNKAKFYINKYYNGELSYDECVAFLVTDLHHGKEAAKINIEMGKTLPSYRKDVLKENVVFRTDKVR